MVNGKPVMSLVHLSMGTGSLRSMSRLLQCSGTWTVSCGVPREGGGTVVHVRAVTMVPGAVHGPAPAPGPVSLVMSSWPHTTSPGLILPVLASYYQSGLNLPVWPQPTSLTSNSSD